MQVDTNFKCLPHTLYPNLQFLLHIVPLFLPVLRMLSDWANEAYPEMDFEQCRIIENGRKPAYKNI